MAPPSSPSAAFRSQQPSRTLSRQLSGRFCVSAQSIPWLYFKPSSGRSFELVKDGDLDKWLRPNDPTLGQEPVWILRKPVVDLAAPASYYFRVSFRWTGGGHVLGKTVRTSQRCHQAELRPDLIVQSIRVKPSSTTSDEWAPPRRSNRRR